MINVEFALQYLSPQNDWIDIEVLMRKDECDLYWRRYCQNAHDNIRMIRRTTTVVEMIELPGAHSK